ncbi:MAG: hypothetical protein Fur0037_14190 [Planctomycetota bacterium]
MTADEQKRSWTRAIFSDPYRKLASIGLAIVFYFYIDKQVNLSHGFDVTLVTVDEASPSAAAKNRADILQVVVPTSKVTVLGFRDAGSDTPLTNRRIRLEVRGRKYAVEAVKRRTQPFVVGPFPSVDWDRTTGFDFTAADIAPDNLLQEVAISLDPPRVHIDLLQNSELPVTPSLDQIAIDWVDRGDEARLKDRLRRETAVFSREKIRIRGPTAELQELRSGGRKPFRAALRARNEDREVEGTVTLNTGPTTHLSMDEGVTVRIQVRADPQAFTLDIPILVDDRSLPPRLRGRYWPDIEPKQGLEGANPARPDLYQSMTVEVNVSGMLLSRLRQFEKQQLAAWAAEHFRLRFWIPPPTNDEEAPQLPPVEARLEFLGPQASLYDQGDFTLAKTVALPLVLHDP